MQEQADLEGQLEALERYILELERQRGQVEQERDEAQREADDLRREVTHLRAMVDDLLVELPDPGSPEPESAYLAPDPATVRVAARELLLGIGRRASDIDPAELDDLVQVYLGMHEQAWQEGGDPDARFLSYFYEDRYAGEIATRESSQEAQRRGDLWQDMMGDMRDQVREGGS